MSRLARACAHVLLAALIAFVLAAGAAQAALTFPPLTGRVVDDAGILSSETQQRLTELSAEHEKQTGNQIVVVTLKSLQGNDIETFGYQLLRTWGIGQKGKNNGALVIIAPNERKTRIEVGYGLEGELTDAQSKLIIENTMLPFFKKGDFDSGALAGTVQVLQTLGGKPSNVASLPQAEPDQQSSHGGGIPIFLIVIILWVVFGKFLWPLLFLGGLGGGRGGWGGGFGGGGFGGGGFGGGGFSGGGGSGGGGGASGGW